MIGRQRIVIVGASLAGVRTAEALRAEGFDGELVILGAEPYRPYDRPPLSKELLTGRAAPSQIALPVDPGLNATWQLGDPAVALDPGARRVTTDAGRVVGYDGLVIATGSTPRRLAALDPALRGVLELRNLDDALALRTALTRRPRVVIVGGGFIGVEVASSAAQLGLPVDLVTLDPPLQVAGPLVTDTLRNLLSDHGVRLHEGRRVVSVEGTGRAERVVLDDRTRLNADVVVSAVGAVPATAWLEDSGLHLDDGIACDAWCAVEGVDDIVAAGDVVRWPNQPFGDLPMRVEHWTNAVEQARAAAATLLHGRGDRAPHTSIPSFWSEHFGLRLQAVGLPGLADHWEVIEGDPGQHRFAAAAYRDRSLIGAVAYNLPRALVALQRRLVQRAAVAAGRAA